MKIEVRNNILNYIMIISFIILIFNRILIYGFDKSISGYLFERIGFFIFIISSIFVYKKSKYKKAIFIAITFILVTNFLKTFKTYLICTNYERQINEKLYLRESTTIESVPALHIMQRDFLIEKNLTSWNTNLNYDKEFENLKAIKKINLVKRDSSMIILKYENENKVMIDTFSLLKNYR